MEDIISTVTDKVDVAIAVATTAGGWLTTKFEWWKNSSKLVKIGSVFAVIAGLAVVLSILT